MSYTLTGTHTVYMQDCVSCGIAFGVPDEFDDRRRDDGKTFYCPNGHTLSYGNTLAKQLKAEREKTARLTARIDQERAERESAQRRAAAARGQVTKIKRRVGRGVCPCCNRSFADLAAHMQTKHPGFVDSTPEPPR